MASIITSQLTSTAATSYLELPTDIARTDDFRSTQNNPADDKPALNKSTYRDLDWTRLKGYTVPSDDRKIESGVWLQGHRLYKASSDRYYWLCRQCHQQRRFKKNTIHEALYVADRSTSGAIQHLREVHKVDQNGERLQPKRKGAIDDYCRMDGYDDAAAVDNTLAAAFDQHHFKGLLYDWVICNNVPFEQLESPQLRRLLTYLNPRASAHIPSSTTASRTVAILYDQTLGTVTETLQSAITKINLSFDLWTSKNKLALLGLCAHFINITGNSITTLLALPRQRGRHSGFNIAETVSDIIASYSLQDKVGYFTTDNATSNQACLDYIAKEHGFERDSRWVRCSGHIFNLVGQAALFGNDSEVFAEQDRKSVV